MKIIIYEPFQIKLDALVENRGRIQLKRFIYQ